MEGQSLCDILEFSSGDGRSERQRKVLCNKSGRHCAQVSSPSVLYKGALPRRATVSCFRGTQRSVSIAACSQWRPVLQLVTELCTGNFFCNYKYVLLCYVQ
jgi:hypothetical protein